MLRNLAIQGLFTFLLIYEILHLLSQNGLSHSLGSDSILKLCRGLEWWYSGQESICQTRGQGFNPWSGNTPHATEQPSLRATSTEARVPRICTLKQEKPPQWEACSWQLEKAGAQQQRPSAAKKTQNPAWQRGEVWTHVPSFFLRWNCVTLFIYLFSVWQCFKISSISVPQSETEPGSQQWKHCILITRSPGNSPHGPCIIYLRVYEFYINTHLKNMSGNGSYRWKLLKAAGGQI